MLDSGENSSTGGSDGGAATRIANDDQTPYHVAEGYDNTVLRILLESGRFNRVLVSFARIVAYSPALN